jgi:hypothetical protein
MRDLTWAQFGALGLLFLVGAGTWKLAESSGRRDSQTRRMAAGDGLWVSRPSYFQSLSYGCLRRSLLRCGRRLIIQALGALLASALRVHCQRPAPCVPVVCVARLRVPAGKGAVRLFRQGAAFHKRT